MNLLDAVVIVTAAAAGGSVLRRTVRTKRSLLPSGVALWAGACVLQVEAVYAVVDALLGGVNLANLLYRSMAVAALGCLSVMVLRATRGLRAGPESDGAIAAFTAALLTAQGGVFFLASFEVSSTYLAEYGGTWYRELFWNTLPLGVAAFSMLVLVTVGREWRSHTVRSTRWGLFLIGLASVIDLVWVAESVASSAMRMAGDPAFLLSGGADPVASVLLMAMISCTGVGVALASAERFVERWWMRVLLVRLTPLWRRAIRQAPQLRVHRSTDRRWRLSWDVEDVLYRRWVEVLDCERARVYNFTDRDLTLLAAVGAAFTGERDSTASSGLSGLLTGAN